jgi:hypothetical protein
MLEKTDNLAVRVASDPTLIKNIYSRLRDPYYAIPSYEEEIQKMRGIRSTEKGVLVSKVTTPEDYQSQLALISAVQNCLDRIHELNTYLYVIQSRYKELLSQANRVITLNYFDELNELKDGVRKTVISVALQPVQDGIDRLQHLIDLGEGTYKHLTATNWNLKEGTEIITQYLSLYKFGATARIPTEV